MTYGYSKKIIVEMRFSEVVTQDEFNMWLSQIEEYLTLKQPFILVMSTAQETSFPSDYRQSQARWYKQFKDLFFQYCLGLVRIAIDDIDRERLNTPALHAAWRVPYYVCLHRADALQWAIQRYL